MVHGKIAVITGAASGIGKAVSSLLLSRGAQVVAVDASQKLLDQLPDKDAFKLQVDVSQKTEVEQLYKQVIQKFGAAPQILVNSAGITRDNLMLKITEEDWNKVIDVNLKGTFLMTQAHSINLIKQLKLAGDSDMNISGTNGSIVNIASASAKGNVGQANYSASKAGVIGLTKTAAIELSRKGIRVNCILPGFIKTPMTDVVPDKVMGTVLQMIPLHRVGQPEEVANLIGFLASNESSYMTGCAIDIDGGLRM